jgi:hypothetical protein
MCGSNSSSWIRKTGDNSYRASDFGTAVVAAMTPNTKAEGNLWDASRPDKYQPHVLRAQADELYDRKNGGSARLQLAPHVKAVSDPKGKRNPLKGSPTTPGKRSGRVRPRGGSAGKKDPGLSTPGSSTTNPGLNIP